MKRKLLAFVCLLAVLVGVFAIGATATTQENTYQVGYAKVDVSPWIKDYPSATNMTDDDGNAIGIPYDSTWADEYASLLTTTSVVVDTAAETPTAVDVGFLAAPVGYTGRIYSTVIDTNGDNLRGKGDGIYVTATTVTDSEENTALFVTLDGIGGYVALLNALKTSAVEAIAAEGGSLTADHIYVNGSHSHRGIDLIRLSSDTTAPGMAYWEYYKQMATDAAVNAYKNSTAATMSKGEVDVSEACGHQMNFIRHYNTTEVDATTGKTIIRGSNFGGSAGTRTSHLYDADDMLYLLQFEPTNGDAPIVLMNWRAHGTMVDMNDALSGDHIGAIRSTMEKAGYRFAFLQGAAGNTVPQSAIESLNTWKTETASGFTYSSNASNATMKTDENDVNHYAHLMTEAAKVCLSSHMESLTTGEIRTISSSYVSNKQKDTAVEIEAAKYWHDTMGGPTAKNDVYTIDGVEYTFGGWPWIYTSTTGETAIFDSQYHVSNAYSRNSTAAAQAATTNSSIRLDAIMLGDEVAMVTCGNEMSDRFSATDELVYDETKGWYLKDNDNDWKDLQNAVYGTPFVLAYTNGDHAYMSNSLSYTYNEGSVAVAGGSYESQTSRFAQGTGEAVIVQFKSMLNTLDNPLEMDCPACNQKVEWTAIDNTTYSTVLAGNTGHYYLVEDVSTTASASIQENATVCLDLNGFSLTSAERVFSLPATATMNFVDSVGTGTVNATMHGNNPIGGISAMYGTCNIYGGTYNLISADIENGTASGGLFSVQTYAHLNIYGGTLNGADLAAKEYSSYTAKNGCGSAIYLYSSGNVYIGGNARIVSGTVPSHGAGTCIYAHDATSTVTLQGSAVVDEIYFPAIEGSGLTVSGAYTGTAKITLGTDVTLTDGMDIGTSDNADLSGATVTCTNDPECELYVSGTNLVLQRDPVAYIGQTPYCTLQDAVNAAEAGATISLSTDVAETVSVTKNLTIDLNGCDIVSITADGCTLTCYDSQTDDYSVANGVYGKLTGNAVAADGYLAVTGDDGTSFHKVDLAITAMSLRASVAGVYYKSEFKADEVASQGITRCGVALSVKGEPNETNMGKTCAYSSFSTIPSNATGTLLKNIMKTSNIDANNARNANMDIYGRPYILTTSGEYIFGTTVQRSLQEQLEAIDAAWNNYTEAAQKTVVAMYRKYANVMNNWNVSNINSAADPAKDDTVKILMVGNSFCYYYVEELYGLMMANTDADRGYSNVEIYNLYYSGCKLNQHYNWWQAGTAMYQLFKTDANGRVEQTPASGTKWKLEDALQLASWDYLSLQGASTEMDYTNSEVLEANKASVAQYAGPLLDYFNELHPNAQLLWHRTWAFEEGRISGSTTYTKALNEAYDAGIQAICDWMCNEFDQDKPYDLKMVNSGAAWAIAREENAKLEVSLIPVGGLCARLGVRNEKTFPYYEGNADAGDGYHDGDIGGGQFLNACAWYETLTGQSCLNNTYKPTTENGKYALSDAFAELLRNAVNAVGING